MKPVNAPVVASNLANSQQPAAPAHSDHGAAAPTGTSAYADAYASALARSALYPSTALVPAHAHSASSPGRLPTASAAMQGASAPGTSGHIPVSGHGSGGHEFQQRAAGLLAYRQQILASNIANADTPGYKAVDVDMSDVLSSMSAGSEPLSMATTASGHIAGHAAPASLYPRLKYQLPYQSSVDGNTVDMDVERAKFAENAIRYEFAMDQAVRHYKHMAEMLKDLK